MASLFSKRNYDQLTKYSKAFSDDPDFNNGFEFLYDDFNDDFNDDFEFLDDDSDFNDRFELSNDEDQKPARSCNKGELNKYKSSKKENSKTSKQTPTTANQVSYIGAGVEIWPRYKIEQYASPFFSSLIPTNFSNHCEFRSREEWIESLKNSSYHIIPSITVESIIEIAGPKIDVILMDPPFGFSWSFQQFEEFLHKIKLQLHQLFFFVWVDPSTITGVVEAFHSCELLYCDSIVIELFDELLNKYIIDSSSEFPCNSKMVLIFRTNDFTHDDLEYERVSDVGYGIVQLNEKSYGRTGTPMIINDIIEKMFHSKHGKQRVFVELFPGFFSRKSGWVLIDEIEDKDKLQQPQQNISEKDDFSSDINHDDRVQEEDIDE